MPDQVHTSLQDSVVLNAITREILTKEIKFETERKKLSKTINDLKDDEKEFFDIIAASATSTEDIILGLIVRHALGVNENDFYKKKNKSAYIKKCLEKKLTESSSELSTQSVTATKSRRQGFLRSRQDPDTTIPDLIKSIASIRKERESLEKKKEDLDSRKYRNQKKKDTLLNKYKALSSLNKDVVETLLESKLDTKPNRQQEQLAKISALSMLKSMHSVVSPDSKQEDIDTFLKYIENLKKNILPEHTKLLDDQKRTLEECKKSISQYEEFKTALQEFEEEQKRVLNAGDLDNDGYISCLKSLFLGTELPSESVDSLNMLRLRVTNLKEAKEKLPKEISNAQLNLSELLFDLPANLDIYDRLPTLLTNLRREIDNKSAQSPQVSISFNAVQTEDPYALQIEIAKVQEALLEYTTVAIRQQSVLELQSTLGLAAESSTPMNSLDLYNHEVIGILEDSSLNDAQMIASLKRKRPEIENNSKNQTPEKDFYKAVMGDTQKLQAIRDWCGGHEGKLAFLLNKYGVFKGHKREFENLCKELKQMPNIPEFTIQETDRQGNALKKGDLEGIIEKATADIATLKEMIATQDEFYSDIKTLCNQKEGETSSQVVAAKARLNKLGIDNSDIETMKKQLDDLKSDYPGRTDLRAIVAENPTVYPMLLQIFDIKAAKKRRTVTSPFKGKHRTKLSPSNIEDFTNKLEVTMDKLRTIHKKRMEHGSPIPDTLHDMLYGKNTQPGWVSYTDSLPKDPLADIVLQEGASRLTSKHKILNALDRYRACTKELQKREHEHNSIKNKKPKGMPEKPSHAALMMHVKEVLQNHFDDSKPSAGKLWLTKLLVQLADNQETIALTEQAENYFQGAQAPVRMAYNMLEKDIKDYDKKYKAYQDKLKENTDYKIKVNASDKNIKAQEELKDKICAEITELNKKSFDEKYKGDNPTDLASLLELGSESFEYRKSKMYGSAFDPQTGKWHQVSKQGVREINRYGFDAGGKGAELKGLASDDFKAFYEDAKENPDYCFSLYDKLDDGLKEALKKNAGLRKDFATLAYLKNPSKYYKNDRPGEIQASYDKMMEYKRNSFVTADMKKDIEEKFYLILEKYNPFSEEMDTKYRKAVANFDAKIQAVKDKMYEDEAKSQRNISKDLFESTTTQDAYAEAEEFHDAVDVDARVQVEAAAAAAAEAQFKEPVEVDETLVAKPAASRRSTRPRTFLRILALAALAFVPGADSPQARGKLRVPSNSRNRLQGAGGNPQFPSAVPDSQRQIGAHAQSHKVLNGPLTLDKVNQNLVQTGELITKNQSKLSKTDKELFNEKYSACLSEFKKLSDDKRNLRRDTQDVKSLKNFNDRVDGLNAEINASLSPSQGPKR